MHHNFYSLVAQYIKSAISVQNENFAEKTSANCSGPIFYVGVALAHAQRTRIHATCALRFSQNFADKTFADGSEMAKKKRKFSPINVFRYTVLQIALQAMPLWPFGIVVSCYSTNVNRLIIGPSCLECGIVRTCVECYI